MNLKQVTDKNLIALAENNRLIERTTITDSLHYLREIDNRRLYSKLGHKSIFDFAVNHLKHSEDEACRRIAAMRLLKEVPHIEEKINSGELTLTNLNQAQTFFRREYKADRKLSKEDKAEFLSRLEGKSKREAEKIIAEVSPEVHVPDKVRAISQTQILYQFTADSALEEKIGQLKGLLAHTHPDISVGELVNWLCDLGIRHLDKGSPAPARVKTEPVEKSDATPQTQKLSRKQTIRLVWRRGKSECAYCKSKYALEVDHIVPRAKGGTDDIENLRLLCRSCNQRAAIDELGQPKMDGFLNRF